MTATLKNLAKLKKAERAKSTKIEHPLARYNNIGQLMCIVCKVNVKTDALWNNHMALPSHRENLLALQKQKSEDNTNTQKRKRVEEEQEQIKKAKMELEVRQQKDFFSENTFKAAPIVPQAEPKVVSQHIPDGFFDDSKQQAQAYLVSNARQVQVGGTYTNQEEIDEEQQLINAMKMKRQQQAKQKNSNYNDDDIEIDVDEIVGVEDFSSLACDSSNKIKIVIEPIKSEQKKDMEEEYGTEMQYPLYQHVDNVVDDTVETHQKIENSIIEDALARRDGFEKMKNLKQKHEETKSKNNIEQGMAERKKERKKKKKMEEDDIEIEGDNIMELDFWRSQGI
jgi:zinc finger protein 830